MTETHAWIASVSKKLRTRSVLGTTVLVTGVVLLCLALGVILARMGAYLLFPVAVILAWGACFAIAVAGFFFGRRRLESSKPTTLARVIEVEGGLRHGSVLGVTEQQGVGSSELLEHADKRVVGWLDESGLDALGRTRNRVNSSLRAGGLVFAAGAIVFVGAGPTEARANQFWNPLGTALGGRGPIEIVAERLEVPFGDSVRIALVAGPRRTITLWEREPGEPWSQTDVVLDEDGRAERVFGPLESDRYFRASSGGRSSQTVHIRVLLPAFLSDLQILARMPAHTGMADEPLAPGPEIVRLPTGSRILTNGLASVPLDSAFWRSETGDRQLQVEGRQFGGEASLVRSGSWRLEAFSAVGPVDDRNRELILEAVPDSVPRVAIPIPGADTSMPASMRRSLVVDAVDDYGLLQVELVVWRVNREGESRDTVVERLPLVDAQRERAVVQWVLDLSSAQYLPGDTAYFLARAYDNSPRTQVGVSETYRTWVPSRAELRDDLREMTQSLREAADSLLKEQGDLTRDMEDLAAERERSERSGRFDPDRTEEELPFNSVERASELAERQEDAVVQTEELREQLRELSDAAWSAGITDPEFHELLAELAGLLDQALTEDLMDRLQDLQQAIEELDPEAMREALRQMAQSANQLQEQLSRGRELFERAAVEGDMETLAADSEDLASRQRQWNEDVSTESSDSALAAREEALADDAEQLAEGLRSLNEMLERSREPTEGVQSALDRVDRALGDMQAAAEQASRGERQNAAQSGESASESLDPVGSELRQSREEIQEGWRREVLDAMDRALVETARIAENQQRIIERLGTGESGPELRGEQAAMRASVDRLVMRLQGAAGRNALVSPQLGAALGFSRLRMSEALDQLQRANPNTRQAEELAGEALDGLNATALQLLRNRSDVAGSESGSGMSEAMERLADLADQQGELSEQTDEMMSMIPIGTPQMMQQLLEMARRQQEVADELDRMDAEGDMGGAEELAEEARELAAMLEAARVDRETVERQEQLFRRLLDAGRSLRSEEEEEREERESRTADPTVLQLPPAESEGQVGGPRFRFPSWAELRSLSPEQRRLVLDYFRRLNGGRP